MLSLLTGVYLSISRPRHTDNGERAEGDALKPSRLRLIRFLEELVDLPTYESAIYVDILGGYSNI